jgi:PAS domain S-box-containing protein
MTPPISESRSRFAARQMGIAAACAGTLGLLGWTTQFHGLTAVVPGYPRMAPATALTMIVAGFALWERAREQAKLSLRGILAGGFVLVMGLLVLAELFGQSTIRVQNLIFPDGRASGSQPSYLAGINFVLAGAALLAAHRRTRWGRWPIDLLPVVVLTISLLALIGFAIGIPSFYGQTQLFPRTALALPTAICFTLLGAGLIFAQPFQGLGRLLTNEGAGSAVARRLLLTPVLIPLSTGLAVGVAVRLGRYDPEFGGWVIAITNIFISTTVIWWVAARLDVEEKIREAAEEKVRLANSELEKRVLQRTAELEQAGKKARWLASFPELNPNPIVEVGLDGFVHYINSAGETAFPGMRTQAFAHPWLANLESESAALREGRGDVLRRVVSIGDQVFSQSITYIANGQRLRVYGTDITERERTAALLQATMAREKEERQRARSSEDRFRTLVEQSLTGIYVIQDDRFAYVNPTMEKITGFSAEELSACPALEFALPEDRGIVAENIRKRMAGLIQEAHYTLRLRRKDGTVAHVEVRGAISEFNGRRAILGSMMDITLRKEAEEKILRMNMELEERVRMRTSQLEAANHELESFSYTVSHDLRAPLRHIHGYVEMLRRATEGRLDDTALRYLKNIGGSSQQMGSLVDDLLAFGRMGRVEVRETTVDLNPIVRQILEELELTTQGRVIDWNVATLPLVRGDPALLKQVFANLIDNAVKYTRGRNPAWIEIGCAPADNGLVTFHVRDNGAGFDMQYVKKLFGVFQRLHRSDEFEGTGIGLASVRRIVQRHGGDARAEGALDKGATIYFSLKPAPAPSAERVSA